MDSNVRALMRVEDSAETVLNNALSAVRAANDPEIVALVILVQKDHVPQAFWTGLTLAEVSIMATRVQVLAADAMRQDLERAYGG